MTGIDSHRTFYAAAVRVPRNVLVDHARRRGAAKRGQDAARVELMVSIPAEDSEPGVGVDLEALDRALHKLEELHPRKTQVVELRCFADLELAAMARELEASLATLKRNWMRTRAFHFRG